VPTLSISDLFPCHFHVPDHDSLSRLGQLNFFRHMQLTCEANISYIMSAQTNAALLSIYFFMR
jgi:hypothetical protein